MLDKARFSGRQSWAFYTIALALAKASLVLPSTVKITDPRLNEIEHQTHSPNQSALKKPPGFHQL